MIRILTAWQSLVVRQTFFDHQILSFWSFIVTQDTKFLLKRIHERHETSEVSPVSG
jgi:hypothetical protein